MVWIVFVVATTGDCRGRPAGESLFFCGKRKLTKRKPTLFRRPFGVRCATQKLAARGPNSPFLILNQKWLRHATALGAANFLRCSPTTKGPEGQSQKRECCRTCQYTVMSRYGNTYVIRIVSGAIFLSRAN